MNNIMPKEGRVPTHSYRQTPAPLPSDTGSGTRVTSIWTAEDDETLMTARAKGHNWQPIATMHFPNKTANACRKRHERLMERRNADDWSGIKLQILATEYMAVRKEMWSILAERIGEKWQTIESKVTHPYLSVSFNPLTLVLTVHGERDQEHPSSLQISSTQDTRYGRLRQRHRWL